MMNEQIFINIPSYGTRFISIYFFFNLNIKDCLVLNKIFDRTHTVILVDKQNKLTFHEKTIEYPIDKKYPKWLDTLLEFNIISK